MRLMVTGGAGFIGAAVARRAVADGLGVITVDALRRTGDRRNLAAIAGHSRHVFVHADIGDAGAMAAAFRNHAPDAVLNLAAESHVDQAIDGPLAAVDANARAAAVLLQAATAHWRALPAPRRTGFRFVQVSTDEVFGALGPDGRFDETSPYAPRSPYAASKAAADHFARAWATTYGLPTIVTHGCNTYGPRQFPEKLIPVATLAALEGRTIPVYGRGDNVRDWLHVDDHAEGLLAALRRGAPGEAYCLAGGAERRNIDVVRDICGALDRHRPANAPHARHIAFVQDRPGHDHRYAMDPRKAQAILDWRPRIDMAEGLPATVAWYLDNADWWRPHLKAGRPGRRIGLGPDAAP